MTQSNFIPTLSLVLEQSYSWTLVQRKQLCKCISIQSPLITGKQECYTNHKTSNQVKNRQYTAESSIVKHWQNSRMLISLCAEWYETLDSRPRLLKGLPLESLLLGLNGWEVLCTASVTVSVTASVTASVAAKSRDILISGGNNCYRSLVRRLSFNQEGLGLRLQLQWTK